MGRIVGALALFLPIPPGHKNLLDSLGKRDKGQVLAVWRPGQLANAVLVAQPIYRSRIRQDVQAPGTARSIRGKGQRAAVGRAGVIGYHGIAEGYLDLDVTLPVEQVQLMVAYLEGVHHRFGRLGGGDWPALNRHAKPLHVAIGLHLLFKGDLPAVRGHRITPHGWNNRLERGLETAHAVLPGNIHQGDYPQGEHSQQNIDPQDSEQASNTIRVHRSGEGRA